MAEPPLLNILNCNNYETVVSDTPMASETAPSSWDGPSRMGSDSGSPPIQAEQPILEVEEPSATEEKDQQFELVD